MRAPVLACVVLAVTAGCGDDGGGGAPDAPGPVPPRVLEGGGIADGPIDGVANIYVFDDATRMPVSGATVQVGDLEGTTDGTGLYIAEGVTGPQTVVVKAGSYRSEMWVGANGSNMTVNLVTSTEPVPPRSTLSGQVDLSSITVAAQHVLVAAVFYSQTDDLGAPENAIPTTPEGANVCNTGPANDQPCTFSLQTRTGKLALLAAVFDRDTKGTLPLTDDTSTLIGWAVRTGITVTGGVDQSGQDLTLVEVANLGNLTVDFGSPPAGHATVGAIIGIDLGEDGVFQIPLIRTPVDPTLLTPKPAAFGATDYRLTAVASSGDTPTSSESIVLRRGLTAGPLAAGAWLAPPGGTMATRTGASWAAVPGATLHTVEYTQGTARLLNITILDDTNEVVVPELVALPAGAVTADINAIGAPGLDLTSFALDEDRDKLAQVSSQPVLIP